MKKAFFKLFTVLCFALTFLTISSCHKEGIGGGATISGIVYHHEKPIPNCTVYIKFNTTDFPGDNPAYYDSQVTANASGKFIFPKLYKGEYYLYGVGVDNSIQALVRGGIGIRIKHNKSYGQDVPVTED